ncbi:MAG: ABC transporter permease [Pseudomonadota bacterium]
MASTAPLEVTTAPRRRGPMLRLFRRKGALVAAILLAASALGAVFAPLVAPFDPFATAGRPLLPPFWAEGADAQFVLGTDGQGRDILSRLLYGARLTLSIGLLSVGIGGAFGMAIGLLSAFFQKADPYLMRLVDVLLSFPAILLGLAVAAIFGPGALAIVVALSVATIPDVARVTRSAAVVVMGQDYIESGRAIGLSNGTLIVRYLALNCISTVFVFLTLRFGQVILIGAALSFLGLGARPPTAELGMMAAQGRDFLFFAPHVATVPSLAIFVIVLSANVLGDALRDVLDPRLRT